MKIKNNLLGELSDTNDISRLSDINRLEEELSIVTDSHRTVAQTEGLSSEAQVQAQTFDQLTELLGQAVPLKPVLWSVPEKSVSVSSRKTLWAIFKRVTTIALSLGGVVAIIFYSQVGSVTQSGSPVDTAFQNVEDDSNDSLSIYNYWGDSFENQLSDFEGEMICMSVASNDVVPIDSSYLDDFSDSGDF